jgi:hypothetical protein
MKPVPAGTAGHSSPRIEESAMYIGIGTVVLIVIIILVVLMLRRR